MDRILALDLGERRIGIAVSDALGITAQGLPTLTREGRRQVLEHLRGLIEEHHVGMVVVGLPLHMDGRAGSAAAGARAFSEMLQSDLGIQVGLWDERLTTVEVERIMAAAGVRARKRKQHRDRLAAVVILQSWLDAHPQDR